VVIDVLVGQFVWMHEVMDDMATSNSEVLWPYNYAWYAPKAIDGF
jgi:hypothetical protein